MMMMLLLWAMVGFLGGVAAYLVAPMALAPVIGRQRIGDLYARHAMLFLERGMLVGRNNGGLDIVATSYSAFQTDRATLDGEQCDWQDPLNRMSRLHNKVFGVTSEEIAIVIDPVICEIGKKMRALQAAGEHTRERTLKFKDETGEEVRQTVREMAKYVELEDGPQLIDPLDATFTIPGDADPHSGEVVKDYTEKSQERFHERFSPLQMASFIIAFASGAGVMWFVISYGGNVEDSADVTVIPGYMAELAIGVVA